MGWIIFIIIIICVFGSSDTDTNVDTTPTMTRRRRRKNARLTRKEIKRINNEVAMFYVITRIPNALFSEPVFFLAKLCKDRKSQAGNRRMI